VTAAAVAPATRSDDAGDDAGGVGDADGAGVG